MIAPPTFAFARGRELPLSEWKLASQAKHLTFFLEWNTNLTGWWVFPNAVYCKGTKNLKSLTIHSQRHVCLLEQLKNHLSINVAQHKVDSSQQCWFSDVKQPRGLKLRHFFHNYVQKMFIRLLKKKEERLSSIYHNVKEWFPLVTIATGFMRTRYQYFMATLLNRSCQLPRAWWFTWSKLMIAQFISEPRDLFVMCWPGQILCVISKLSCLTYSRFPVLLASWFWIFTPLWLCCPEYNHSSSIVMVMSYRGWFLCAPVELAGSPVCLPSGLITDQTSISYQPCEGKLED